MKFIDVQKGQIIRKRHTNFIGHVVDKSTNGVLLVRSYFDNCNHFINAHAFVPLEIEIEPDGELYHAWCPFFKGCHTQGDTKEEAHENLKSAIQAYIQSMIKHGELPCRNLLWRQNEVDYAQED